LIFSFASGPLGDMSKPSNMQTTLLPKCMYVLFLKFYKIKHVLLIDQNGLKKPTISLRSYIIKLQ